MERTNQWIFITIQYWL